MNHLQLFQILAFIIIGMPALLVLLLGIASLLNRPFSERLTSRMVQFSVITGLLASLAFLFCMLYWNITHVPIAVGNWVKIEIYHFTVKFMFDRLSVPFVILTFILCGTIGAFANRYLHRERGYNRFFVLYSIFMLGMLIATLSGTIETLFAGWELVGLSSAMLVAFFHDRPAPCENGLRVWSVYRISDAALLIASVLLHHHFHHGDFDLLFGYVGENAHMGWPISHTKFEPAIAIAVGLCLIVAAAGKSALVPFSGWLPRAMEGPTPSSAVFYGALSVHLGAFLLLRFSPMIHESWLLRIIVMVIGILTVVVAALAERVQTDIKSDLSFASLTQVGVIIIEIGMGLPVYLPLIHILGHACFRTLQFLRAPTLLHDYRVLENAIGSHLPHSSDPVDKYVPDIWHVWWYRVGIEQGYLDAFLNEYIARPFVKFFTMCNRLEEQWTQFLSGGRSAEPEQNDPFEELL